MLDIFEGRGSVEGPKKAKISSGVKPHLFKGGAPKKLKCNKGKIWADSRRLKETRRKVGLGPKKPKCHKLQKREILLKAVPTDDYVADLMTQRLAAARTEELLSKLGARRCARGACGRILDCESRS